MDELDDLTKDQLLALARERGISPANAAMSKGELREAITRHAGQKEVPTQAVLEQRAEAAGYTLETTDQGWYAEIHGTRWGPIATAEELDEFLPKE